MLKRNGKTGYPRLVPDPKGKVFSILPLSMIAARLKKFPSIPSLLSIFYHEKVLDFIKYIFCILCAVFPLFY